MDRFKFRALFRNKETGETMWQFTEPNHILVPEIEKMFKQISPWLQCTDKKDKNDRVIFEGDIIETRLVFCKDVPRGQIKFKDGCFVVEWINNDEKLNDILCVHGPHSEIIGNIYENPELLDT